MNRGARLEDADRVAAEPREVVGDHGADLALLDELERAVNGVTLERLTRDVELFEPFADRVPARGREALDHVALLLRRLKGISAPTGNSRDANEANRLLPSGRRVIVRRARHPALLSYGV
jgi:hypothetical protein